MRKRYTLSRMRKENGSWKVVKRDFKVPLLFKKRKIKQTIKSVGEYGKYKISKGKDKALFVIEYNYSGFHFRKSNNEIVKKHNNDGNISIELSYRKDTERGYKKLTRWFGVDFISEALKEEIENAIAEHEIPTSGIYLYQARKRYGSGVFDKAILKMQRNLKTDTSNSFSADTLIDISSGEIIWQRTNPTSQKKFLAAFELRGREREKEIAEAEKKEEMRVAEEKEIREAAAEKERKKFKKEIKESFGFTI